MSTYHDLQRQKEEQERRQRELELRQREQEKRRQLDICQKDHTSARNLLESLLQSDVKDFLDCGRISETDLELTRLGRVINQSSSIEILHQSDRNLASLRESIKAETKAATRKKKEHLCRVAAMEKELTATLNDQRSRLNTLQNGQYGSYIAVETLACRQNIDRLHQLLQNQQFDEVVDSLSQLSEELAMAKENAIIRHEQQQKATALLVEIKALTADPVNMTWVGNELARLEKIIATLLEDFAQGRYPQSGSTAADSTLTALAERRDALILEAGERQKDEEERKKAVRVFIDALKEAGFSVSDPQLEGGLRSAVLITATKPGRSRKQEVGVRVNLDGRIEMDVDGGDPGDVRKIQESRIDRQQEGKVACRQVAARIMEFVAKKGVALEEVKRDWHNPDRIAKGAKDLPKGSGNTTGRI